MKKFIGMLLNWLKFWNDDYMTIMDEAYEERPDMELYDDCYPWSRR